MNSEQNTTMARVPDDHPLMVAWNEYKALPDYENTKQWATAPAHTEGSLWAAFMAGWYKARALDQREGWRENGDAALSHISNALEDLESSPDQRPVPQLREAMHYVRAMLAAAPKFGGA